MSNHAFSQLSYLIYEIRLIVNRRWWRWLTIWFSSPVWILVTYRVERFLYLVFGCSYGLLRLILLPFLFISQPWRGNAEIHYRADIGKGLKVLHPSLGVVINGNTKCGSHLTLTGENCIGGREALHEGGIDIGNNVSLGVNAVILGPVVIGNNMSIGAGAVVIHDAQDDSILVGVPAKPVSKS